MDQATIAKIVEVAQLAGDPNKRIIVPAGCPLGYVLVSTPDGIKNHKLPDQPAKIAAHSLAAIYDWLFQYTPSTSSHTVYYSRGKVIGVCEAGTITYELPFHPVYSLLRSAPTIRFNQADLYRQLRTNLRGCVDATLAAKVGKIDVKKAMDSSTAVATGKVSLSKSMIAEASGVGELPSTLDIRLPMIWDRPIGCPVVIKADFDLDPQTETFSITPYPGEVEAAAANSESWIRDELAAIAEATTLMPNLVCGIC